MNEKTNTLILPASQVSLQEIEDVYIKSWNHMSIEILDIAKEKVKDPSEMKINPTFVAVVDNMAAGFCEINFDWLDRLYVSPDFFGKNIGIKLLNCAVSNGANKLWVDEGNSPARRFYEKHGWVYANFFTAGYYYPESDILLYELQSCKKSDS